MIGWPPPRVRPLPSSSMPNSIRILIVVLTAIFLLSATAMVVLGRRVHAVAAGASGAGISGRAEASLDPSKPVPGMEVLRIPSFSLKTQDGLEITQEVFKGRVTVVDFMFTQCPFVCPTLTQKMRDVSRRLQGTGVRFLSVSVDPEHDTPAVLKAYAERADADLRRWNFATGPKDKIYSIVKDGLKFALYEQTDKPIKLESGQTMSNIVHPPWFVLVGPEGQVLGIYSVTSAPEAVEQLAARAKAVDGAIKR